MEIVNGPNYSAKSYPRYCSRGYGFRIQYETRTRPSADYGISVKSGNDVYYGILRKILEVRYPGMVDLRCIVFKCDWYDPVLGRGVDVDQFGVCYIRYHRITRRSDPWVTVTAISPRGRIYGVSPHDALQPIITTPMDPVAASSGVDLVVDLTQIGIVHSESEEEQGEFYEDTDSITSEGSSSSDSLEEQED
ncbi:hypothetical protein V5N11_018978 [Cardamine amara subsp. amara]|uniref:DUF4216 domain-containing protein n=1 Tax=Cardamine amara subsp. amara TaxID=228776 RepID=A0ABD1BZR6_CARAN